MQNGHGLPFAPRHGRQGCRQNPAECVQPLQQLGASPSAHFAFTLHTGWSDLSIYYRSD